MKLLLASPYQAQKKIAAVEHSISHSYSYDKYMHIFRFSPYILFPTNKLYYFRNSLRWKRNQFSIKTYTIKLNKPLHYEVVYLILSPSTKGTSLSSTKC